MPPADATNRWPMHPMNNNAHRDKLCNAYTPLLALEEALLERGIATASAIAVMSSAIAIAMWARRRPYHGIAASFTTEPVAVFSGSLILGSNGKLFVQGQGRLGDRAPTQQNFRAACQCHPFSLTPASAFRNFDWLP